MLRSSTVSVVLLIVVVSPLTVRSPVTTRSCPIVVVPPPSPPVPMFTVVAAAPTFNVVGVANALNVASVESKSPPLISTSCAKVVLPVAAPTLIAVASPAILIVVAVSFNSATVVSLVLNVASTSTSPVNVALPLVSIVKRV